MTERRSYQSAVLDEPPRGEEWDVVVIGTGMGGATAGYALAKQGHRVLFIEKGHFLFGEADRGNGLPSDEDVLVPQDRLKKGLWPRPLSGKTTFGEIEFYAPLGCGTGGTTSLYGAQLERLQRSDFFPRRNYPNIKSSTLPERWPITYEELAPYYDQAESLFDVCGLPDPLAPETESSLRQPPPLSPRDQDLYDSFGELGLHPYRAHVGCSFIEGCGECGGVLCPKACKSDSGRRCLLPALERHGAKILPECDVLRLEADADRIRHIQCRRHGEEFTISANVVVLAAGAYMSPILLLNSRSELWPRGLANRSGMVGRNLMFHATDMIAVNPRLQLSDQGPKKAISVNDFYQVGDTKLGTLQSLGVPVNSGWVLHFLRSRVETDPRLWRVLTKPLLRIVAPIAAYCFRNAAVLATIVEDLPYHGNRVFPDPTAPSGMRFEYKYPAELRLRNRLFRRELIKKLRRRHRIFVLTNDNNINYGHVCGTCRFGDDPKTSVLNRDNRAHDVENLYVVDASFFPSSGGTNPSLTIAANALRVAEAIGQTPSKVLKMTMS